MRNFLNQSEQGAVDSGRYDVWIATPGEERIVDIDEAIRAKDAAKSELRRPELPSFWAGRLEFRDLRDMLFVVLPAYVASFQSLHSEVFASLCDAGYRAVDVESAEGLPAMLEEAGRRREDMFGSRNAVIVVGGGVGKSGLAEELVAWGSRANIAVVLDDLLENDPAERTPEAFRTFVPATSPANFTSAPHSQSVEELCYLLIKRLIKRVAADADERSGILRLDERARKELGDRAVETAEEYLSASARRPETWSRKSQGVDEFLDWWLAMETAGGRENPHAVQEQFQQCGFASVFDRWPEPIEKVADAGQPIIFLKMLEYGEFRYARSQALETGAAP